MGVKRTTGGRSQNGTTSKVVQLAPKEQPFPTRSEPQSLTKMTKLVDRDAIARHAYELFLARGGKHGSDVEDWLQAERDLAPRS